MKRLASMLFALLLGFAALAQAEVKDQVVQAIGTGNATALARHLQPNLDLTVLATSDVYSKAQSEQILRKFFDEHDPQGLTIEHEGTSKMGDRYYIGRLRTARGDMRVTFFLKQTGGVFQVKQLRIETAKGDL
jgi:hypothetical protein